MKKIYIIAVLSFLFFKSYSQDFLGISTGNFSGVSGVMLQPASIVDSRHKFDINLFSTSVNYSNNYFLVNRDAILKFNKNSFNDYQTFKTRYLTEASLPTGERVFLNVNNRTQVPLSFMATTGKKSAIALNIQSRSMIQGRGISQDLARMAYNGFYFPPLNNNTIDASGFNLKALNWAEVGFTYGRVLYSSDKHFFKAAVTGKYLAGVASINMGSNDIRFSVNNDSSLNFNTNRFDYNHNKNADFDMAFDKNFSPDANAVGFDAGLVYEYRGNFQKFKYIRNDDEKSYLADRRDVNKYIFKLGVSLLDVGMFRFQNPDNVNSFNANITNWNLASANYNTIREFDTALANRVVAIPGSRFYNAYLPAALSVQFDLRFVKGFYLNAMAYRPVNIGKDAGQRFNSYGFYTITPRWESRHFGVYIPYTISDKNSLTNYRGNLLGATVRMGPLFIGSSNLGTMLFNENLKAADVHVGLKIGITYGKPNKSSTYVDRLFSKKSDEPLPLITRNNNNVNDPVLIRKIDTVMLQRNDTNRLFVDYNKGKIYDIPNSKGNIIIVNNYYYGDAPTPVIKSDISGSQDTLVEYYKQLNLQKDSMLLQINNAENDRNKKLIADSINYKRKQLDSLIREMQLLRIQMDSVNTVDSLDVSILPSNNEVLINEQRNMAGIKSKADTVTSKTFVNQGRESIALASRPDSFSQNNVIIKKKNSDTSKVKVAVRDTGSLNNSSASFLNNQQKEVSQRGVVNRNEKKSADSTKVIVAINDTELSKASNASVLNDRQNDVKRQRGLASAEKKSVDSSKLGVAIDDTVFSTATKATVLNDRQTDGKPPVVLNAVETKSVDSNKRRVAIDDTATYRKTDVKVLNDREKDVNLQVDSPHNLKKNIDGSNAKLAINGSEKAKTSTTSVSNEQEKDLKRQIVKNAAADSYNRQRELDQERLINEFRNETSRIRNDIARLQASSANSNRNYRGNNSVVPIILPSTRSNETVYKTAPVRRDTVYIRDTVKQRDTVRITSSDTVRLLIDKPVVKEVPAQMAISPVKVLRDTIIKQASFDYAKMPETVVLFGLGKATVQQVYFKRLDFIAGVLLKEKVLQVAITGHSDKSGSPETNRALSLKRAQNISTYLISKGVASEQINTNAVSYLEPAVQGNTNNANSQNRRVVIQFL